MGVGTYGKYFNENLELLIKLTKLHEKKQTLRGLIEERKQNSPYVVELCGLPRTGKTTSVERVYDFFKFGDITIERAEEPAFLIKNSMTKDELSKLSNLDFNDKTLEVSKESLERAKQKNPSIILMDRGVIDNYFWYQMMYNEGAIDEEVYKDRLKTLSDDLKSINKLFVMSAKPEIIIYRDYINSLFLEDRKKTTIEKVSRLKEALDQLSSKMPNDSDIVQRIDSTELSEMETSIIIADSIMDSMLLNLKSENQRKIIDTDYQRVNITAEGRKKIVEAAKKHPDLYQDTPVNVVMGKFYTDEEYEKHVDESLNRPLPGIEEPKNKALFFSKSKK